VKVMRVMHRMPPNAVDSFEYCFGEHETMPDAADLWPLMRVMHHTKLLGPAVSCAVVPQRDTHDSFSRITPFAR
jgi:hypothetical protein